MVSGNDCFIFLCSIPVSIHYKHVFLYFIEHSYNNFFFFSGKSNIWIISELDFFVCLFSRERVLFFWFFKCWVILDCILNVVHDYVVHSLVFLQRVVIFLVCSFVSRHLTSFNSDCKLCLGQQLKSQFNNFVFSWSLSYTCTVVWFRAQPEMWVEFIHRIRSLFWDSSPHFPEAVVALILQPERLQFSISLKAIKMATHLVPFPSSKNSPALLFIHQCLWVVFCILSRVYSCFPLEDLFSRHLNSTIQEVKLWGSDLEWESRAGEGGSQSYDSLLFRLQP